MSEFILQTTTVFERRKVSIEPSKHQVAQPQEIFSIVTTREES